MRLARLHLKSPARLAARTCVLMLGMATIGLSSCTAPTPQVDTTSIRQVSEADILNARAAALIVTDPDEAESILNGALAADPFHGPAHNNLGTLLLRRGDLGRAVQHFQQARRLMPGNPDPRLNLGLTFEAATRYDEALDAYAAALDVAPDHIPAMQALTRLQVRTGKTDEHLQTRLRAIGLNGDSIAWREWAKGRLSRVP